MIGTVTDPGTDAVVAIPTLKSELASDLLPCLRQAEVASPFVSASISWES
jgi:hypothetical protein